MRVPRNSRMKRGETRQAVIKHQIAHTMRHLSDGNTAKSSSHQVVDGRRFYLAGSLPHQTSTEGVWHRFPEVHAMTSCSVEIESAMVWMGKQIGRELVVIPHEIPFRILCLMLWKEILANSSFITNWSKHCTPTLMAKASRAAFQGCFFCRSGCIEGENDFLPSMPPYHISFSFLAETFPKDEVRWRRTRPNLLLTMARRRYLPPW